MSDIRYDWVKEQVGDLQGKSPDNKDAWISNALKGKKGIVNAQDVFVIQSALKSLGYDPGKIDGVYREKGRNTSCTITAVRDFQTKNGLIVDGKVGPKTIAKLIEKLGTPSSTKSEAPSSTKSEAPSSTKSEAPSLVEATRGFTLGTGQPVGDKTPSPTEETEKLGGIKLASSASTEFKRLGIYFKEGTNNAQLLQFAPGKEYYIDITGNDGKNTTYTSESVVKEGIGFLNDTESIVFQGGQFIITNKDNTQELMRVRLIVRSIFETTNSDEKALLKKITSQGFEVRIDPTEHGIRKQLYLYKDGLRIHSTHAPLGNIPALGNLIREIPYILDPTLQGREDAEREKENEMRRQQLRQDAQAREKREKYWKTLGDVLPKSKAKLTTLDNLKIAPQNVIILQQAEIEGFTFAYDGSRSNGINIVKANQEIVGNVRVFANSGWQDELVTIVQGLIKSKMNR